MLQVSAGINLGKFIQPSLTVSPFLWPHLDLSPDQGPDMVCAFFYLAYHKKLNVSANWDIDHASSNAGKNALKKSGLWPTCILLASANNAVYGSTMRIFVLLIAREPCCPPCHLRHTPLTPSLFLIPTPIWSLLSPPPLLGPCPSPDRKTLAIIDKFNGVNGVQWDLKLRKTMEKRKLFNY